jgi:hypothetical protein
VAGKCAWARVHAEHPRAGELGVRSIIAEEALKAVPALARRSAQRGLEDVQAAVAALGGAQGCGGDRYSFLGSWMEISRLGIRRTPHAGFCRK